MKIKEQLASFSQALSNEFSNLGVMSKGGIEGAQAVNDANKVAASEEKNKKEKIIKRPIKSGLATKLVGNTKMDKPIGKLYTMGKSENKEATGAGAAGGYVGPLFGEFKESSKAKKQFEKDIMTDPEYIQKKKESQIYDEKGNVIGSYGTPNVTREDPFIKKGKFSRIKLGDKKDTIKKEETKEATGAGSAGAYVTTAAWSPSMSKKDWIGKSKPQYPGGKFVQVKKKCTKFPYCNQGDIKSLKLTEHETVKKIITKISKEQNISENVIKAILSYEYENRKLQK